MIRQNYTFVLEITPVAPLTHGQGTEGNTQILMTRDVVVEQDGQWRRLAIPGVSGAAFKATLREWAVLDGFERAGVQPGSVSKDALRLVLKGGKNDSGGQTVPLDEARRLRDLFPALSVFGSMDGGLPLPGRVQVSDVLPWCQELVDADLAPVQIVPLHVEGVAQPLPAIVLYEGHSAPPVHLVRTEVTYYRHDMNTSHLLPMMQRAAVRMIEESATAIQAKRKAGEKPRANERREANESMPHSLQAIAPGTPMFAIVRLHGATEVELGCLVQAMTRWIGSGAHLGGASSKGHGACRVRIAGAMAHTPAHGHVEVAKSTVVDLPRDGSPVAATQAYGAHVTERAERIRAWLAESTR
jgi:hypothetical protein